MLKWVAPSAMAQGLISSPLGRLIPKSRAQANATNGPGFPILEARLTWQHTGGHRITSDCREGAQFIVIWKTSLVGADVACLDTTIERTF